MLGSGGQEGSLEERKTEVVRRAGVVACSLPFAPQTRKRDPRHMTAPQRATATRDNAASTVIMTRLSLAHPHRSVASTAMLCRCNKSPRADHTHILILDVGLIRHGSVQVPAVQAEPSTTVPHSPVEMNQKPNPGLQSHPNKSTARLSARVQLTLRVNGARSSRSRRSLYDEINHGTIRYREHGRVPDIASTSFARARKVSELSPPHRDGCRRYVRHVLLD